MTNKQFDRICSVCGDKASGFHFDVISCESCKSFFRRNALKKKNIRCFLGGNCQIDVFSRTFCKKCRLKKCFDSGMKTENILTDEQKRLRKLIIDQNRQRKAQNQSQSGSEKSSFDLNLTIDCQSSDSFGFNDCDNQNTSVIISSDITTVFPNTGQLILTIDKSIIDYNKTFNECEGNHLSELFNAIVFMADPYVDCCQQINNCWDAIYILHLKLEIDIKKLIKMAKSLTRFTTIDENDQIILLKYASIEIILIRMLLNFNFEIKGWNITTENYSNLIKLELLKDGRRNCYETHKQFLQNIEQEWDSDPVIIDLLTVILLFNPNRPKLNHKSIIKLQQQIYLHLLNRYLVVKYQSESYSKTKFAKLMNSLFDLHVLNEKIRLNCLELDLHETPLVKEICDRDSLFQ